MEAAAVGEGVKGRPFVGGCWSHSAVRTVFTGFKAQKKSLRSLAGRRC